MKGNRVNVGERERKRVKETEKWRDQKMIRRTGGRREKTKSGLNLEGKKRRKRGETE